MEIEFLLQDNLTGTIYDASTLLISATWSGQLSGQPGKLTFDIVRDNTLTFYEGSTVRLVVDGFSLFFGWVFSKSRKDDEKTSVTAYDQLRYLKNSDSYVFPISGVPTATASERFAKLCTDFQLKHRVVHPSSYQLPKKQYSGKTLADICQDGIDLTLINTGRWFLFRDNFGIIEFLDMAKLRTDLVLGDASLMTGYDYQTSIDDDTYNQIKLVQENKETAKREIYIVKDSSAIARWGMLQHYEKVNEKSNAAQIKLRAEQLIRLKNRVTRKLQLECIGDWRVMPGNGIWVETQLDDMLLSRYMVVHSCSHMIKNWLHTMKLTLEVVENAG